MRLGGPIPAKQRNFNATQKEIFILERFLNSVLERLLNTMKRCSVTSNLKYHVQNAQNVFLP